MNNYYLVTVCVKQFYSLEVRAPDDTSLFNFKDPEYAKNLPQETLEKLNHPELHSGGSKRTVNVYDVTEGVAL